MGTVSPLRRPAAEPVPLHGRALDNLRYIRETMEGVTSFTAVSGWGDVYMGVVALIAAGLAWRAPSAGAWLAVWLGAAALALAGSAALILRKARATGISLSSGPARKCALGFAPPVLAGAALTIMLARAGLTEELPGVWLLLYGAGTVSGGAYSIRTLPVMGGCFMALGAVALVAPADWGDAFMAAGFGGLHLAFGAVIARKHGG